MTTQTKQAKPTIENGSMIIPASPKGNLTLLIKDGSPSVTATKKYDVSNFDKDLGAALSKQDRVEAEEKFLDVFNEMYENSKAEIVKTESGSPEEGQNQDTETEEDNMSDEKEAADNVVKDDGHHAHESQ